MGARVLALRIDQFENVWESASYTVASGTETAYTDRLTLSFTPAKAVRHLILGAASFRISSTSVSGYVQAVLDNPSTTFCEIIHEGQNANSYNTTPGFAAVVQAAASVSNLKWQTKTETGTSTHYINGQGFIVLQLETSASVTGSLNAAVAKTLSATAGANAAVAAARPATLGADAAAAGLRSVSFAADAAALALRTTAAQLAAAVEAARARACGGDAALATIMQAAVAVETALLTSLDRQAALDVLVAATGTTNCAVLADAAVAAMRSSTASLDAAVRTVRTATAALQAAVSAGRLTAAGLDAVLTAAAATVFAATPPSSRPNRPR